MLYYLVKYRYKIIFCVTFILGIVIELLTGIINKGTDILVMFGVIVVTTLIAYMIMLASSLFYNSVVYKIICNHVEEILDKYVNKPKKFNFFYKECISDAAVSLIDSIMKKYRNIGRNDKDLYTKLSKYKSFIRKTKANSYNEAINVLTINTLFDEHIQLINEVFYESNEIDRALKKVLEEKDDKLAKILEEELATKPKNLKKVEEYYS